MEKGENRFQKMARTHPTQHKYCMDKLGLREVLAYVGVTEVDAIPEKEDEPLKSSNPHFKNIKIVTED